MEKKFYLSRDKKIGGVAAGVAKYFNFDVTAVRFLWVISVLLMHGFSLFLYIAIWMLADKEPEPTVV